MMTELKPCPFCGGEKLKIEHTASSMYKSGLIGVEPYTFSVRCNKCHARGATVFGYLRYSVRNLSEEAEKVLETREQLESRAIEAWNRRVSDG